MISEDLSNDAENTALHRAKLHFKIYLNRKQLSYILIIFHHITVFFCDLVENKRLISKLKINFNPVQSL